MTVDVGDIIRWKALEHNQYFLVVAIDTGRHEPYVCLCLNNGGYESFTGKTFHISQYWEKIA